MEEQSACFNYHFECVLPRINIFIIINNVIWKYQDYPDIVHMHTDK